MKQNLPLTFLIPISLQPIAQPLWYFKLRLLVQTDFIVLKISKAYDVS